MRLLLSIKLESHPSDVHTMYVVVLALDPPSAIIVICNSPIYQLEGDGSIWYCFNEDYKLCRERILFAIL